mmetsp:Transcript_33123/g.100170  ORF Transcript_33123/g.100170 Transcript_33123/m.100170 type:complete len:393 (+) Transcript_33123:53-1231(+)
MDGLANPRQPPACAVMSVTDFRPVDKVGSASTASTGGVTLDPHPRRRSICVQGGRLLARQQQAECLSAGHRSAGADLGGTAIPGFDFMGRLSTPDPSQLCQVCHRFEKTYELGCAHQACRWCAIGMHGCGICGEVITSRGPILDYSFGVDDVRAADESGRIYRESMSPASPASPVTPVDSRSASGCLTSPETDTDSDSDDSTPKERLVAPCMICENRRQAAAVSCKNQCVVYTCGSCASKHKKCFMCNGRVVRVDEEGDDEHMFSSRGMGCDVCSRRSRVVLVECQMGCHFRVCAECHGFTKQCCGLPVKTGGPVGSIPERQSIDWRSSKTLSVSAVLASRLSVRQDTGTSTSGDAQRRAQLYMQSKCRASASDLKPLYPDGGFMGYRDEPG